MNPSHTHDDGCYLLRIANLNMPLSETAWCKDKGCKDGNVNPADGRTTATLFCRCLLHSTGAAQHAVRHINCVMGDGHLFSPPSPPLFLLILTYSQSHHSLLPPPVVLIQCPGADGSQICSQCWRCGSKQMCVTPTLTEIQTSVQIWCASARIWYLWNVCRHAVVTPRGLLYELRPFAHTVLSLAAITDGCEGSLFHLANIYIIF